MHHRSGVGIGHGLADSFEDAEKPPSIVAGVRSILQQRRESPALHQLHGEKRAAIGAAAEFQNGNHARVLELAADLRLLDEPLHHGRVAGMAPVQHLDGHLAAELSIAALQHHAHAPAGDLAVDLVAGKCLALGHLARGSRLEPARGLGSGWLRQADARTTSAGGQHGLDEGFVFARPDFEFRLVGGPDEFLEGISLASLRRRLLDHDFFPDHCLENGCRPSSSIVYQ